MGAALWPQLGATCNWEATAKALCRRGWAPGGRLCLSLRVHTALCCAPMLRCRCGNVAAIMEVDEHLSKNYKVRSVATRPACMHTGPHVHACEEPAPEQVLHATALPSDTSMRLDRMPSGTRVELRNPHPLPSSCLLVGVRGGTAGGARHSVQTRRARLLLVTAGAGDGLA